MSRHPAQQAEKPGLTHLSRAISCLKTVHTLGWLEMRIRTQDALPERIEKCKVL